MEEVPADGRSCRAEAINHIRRLNLEQPRAEIKSPTMPGKRLEICGETKTVAAWRRDAVSGEQARKVDYVYPVGEVLNINL